MDVGLGGGFWGILLIGGPILLLALMLYGWLSNRSAVKRRGSEDAALGTTNAVEGSPNARPDLAQDEARAKRGESVDDRLDHADGGTAGGANGGGE